VHVLSPTEWVAAHSSGGTSYVWSPPPAAAAAAIEWLGQYIHKRPDSVHIIVIPRLMTSSWRKRLAKTSDLLFTTPVGNQVWSSDEHEPPICALCLPLSQHSPWSHRRTVRVKGVLKRLPKVWEKGDDSPGCILRQLLGQTRSLGKM
jgi:hypothetical protein